MPYLGFIMVVEGCQPPPRRAFTGQFDHARGKHEAEEKPPDQPEGDGVVVMGGRVSPLVQIEGCDEDGKEPGLEEEDVPLEPEECLTHLIETRKDYQILLV